MSIKVDKIEVARGESLMIYLGGSAEIAIAVRVDEDGTGHITGPMNENSRTLEVTVFGMKESGSGVQLRLEPGTRIPIWIRNQSTNVEATRERVNGRTVRLLTIKGSGASFLPGGVVAVKMPGAGEFCVGFQSLKVLEILDLQGNLIKRNHHLCTECFTNTGEMIDSRPAAHGSRVDATFQCVQCGYQYELEGI